MFLRTKSFRSFCSVFLIYIINIPVFSQPDYSIKKNALRSLKETGLDTDSVNALFLRGRKLKNIPENICRFRNLRGVDFKKNKLTEFPSVLNCLTNIEVIQLERNRISNLSEDILHHKNLKYLGLGMNPIKVLPESLGNLEQLEFLQLWGTEITSIPESFRNLKNLRWLDMRNILMSEDEKQAIREILPKTQIYFSAGCNCSY